MNLSRPINLTLILAEIAASRLKTPFFKKDKPRGERILVFGYFGLGDAIMFLPTLRALKEQFPNSRITVVASRKSTAWEALEMSGCVTETLFFEFKEASAAERYAFNSELLKRNFDTAICIHVTPLQYFLPVLLKIPARIGHVVPWHTWWQPRPNWILNFRSVLKGFDKTHEIDRYRALLKAADIDNNSFKNDISLPVSEQSIAEAREMLLNLGIADADFVVGIHASVGYVQSWKSWGREKFVELGKLLKEKHNAKILILGAENESQFLKELAAEIGENAFAVIPPSGKSRWTLEPTLGVLKRCNIVIGNDSGVGHIAIAVGVPTVRIFGMTDFWGYKALESPHIDIWKNLPCSPCVSIGMINPNYNLHTCGHRNCIKTITVAEVFKEVEKLA
ncbi:MAG: glycosyltransferase family 9 protein [Bacteroidota bacterium]